MSNPIEDRDPGDRQTVKTFGPEMFGEWVLREERLGTWLLSRDGCTIEIKTTWNTIGVSIDGGSDRFPGRCDFPPIAAIERALKLRRDAIIAITLSREEMG